MSWIKAVSLERLRAAPVVVSHPPLQIAIVRSGDAVYAVDNRCPHEGYPLASGTVSEDSVLTCNWHNWKFRLSDGRCVIGGDNVRSYPTRIDRGDVYVDVSPRPRHEVKRDILTGLREAFDERDFGRICREIARLDFEGLDPLYSVRSAFGWAHDRLEFGTTHATAAAADWLELWSLWPSDRERRLVCLAEAVDHLSFDSLRRPAYAYPDAGESFDSNAFGEAIETESVTRAEAMVRRGLFEGLRWVDMEEDFLAASLAHYNSFGHCLIYVMKIGQAIDRLGPGVEASLLLPMTRKIGYATREDLIPEFSGYASALARLPEPRFGGSDHEVEAAPPVPWPTTLSDSFAWLQDAIGRYPVTQVYDRMLEALGLNLLHYDMSYQTATDRPVSQNIGWLDFTHGLTFANAARRLCSRYPGYWRPALLQMACFLGRNHGFLDRGLDSARWQVSDAEVFFEDVYVRLMDHGIRDPLFSCHLLKTSLAVNDERHLASSGCRRAMLAGLNRFLNAPLKMKHVRRNARQAIALVARDYGGET